MSVERRGTPSPVMVPGDMTSHVPGHVRGREYQRHVQGVPPDTTRGIASGQDQGLIRYAAGSTPPAGMQENLFVQRFGKLKEVSVWGSEILQ